MSRIRHPLGSPLARLASRLGDAKWGRQVSIAAPDGRRNLWWEK